MAVKKARPKREVPRKSSAGKVVIKLDPETAPVVHRNQPSTGEINNIIAGTIERIYEEFGSELDVANCQDKAMHVTRFLKHGIVDGRLVRPPKLTEKTLKVPLCRKCRTA